MRNLWPALLWLKVTSVAAAPLFAQPHGDQTFTYVQAEQLEYRIATDGPDTFSWDVRGWVGGDYNCLWFKTQGDNHIDGPVENGEVQLRYSRLVSPFWELAVGARYDVEPDPSRAYAVFALHGLAPYLYESEVRRSSATSSAACSGISNSTTTQRWRWSRRTNQAPTRSYRLRDISECIIVR